LEKRNDGEYLEEDDQRPSLFFIGIRQWVMRGIYKGKLQERIVFTLIQDKRENSQKKIKNELKGRKRNVEDGQREVVIP